MSFIAIVDYGMCNLDSIARAVDECGGTPKVTEDPADLDSATHVILPGVGAFPDAIDNLRQRGLDVAIRRQVEANIPLLGICLGMQLLATRGFEVRETPGLDVIPGEVRRLSPASGERIPHVGWNEVYPAAPHPLFDGIAPGKDFYFVHSFHFCCADEADVLARAPYCGGFAAAVRRKNVLGVQFHPEKSQRVGFRLLKNFLAMR